jgi:phosphopantothenoylcysteine decarboxylase / phosphopantothenate---cysteine ligase
MKSTSKPTILITAGPTREKIDPVRYISNHSTGVMGYRLAEEAVIAGYDVILISGPVALSDPGVREYILVETADEMKEEVNKRIFTVDCLIMAAAVSDYKPKEIKEKKIKKSDSLTLELIKTPDILADLLQSEELVKVGFALETDNLVENATKKLADKHLDMIVANGHSEQNDPFGEGNKEYTLIDKENRVRTFKDIDKKEIAGIILKAITERISEKNKA